MAMNNKGQVIAVTFMVAAVIVLLAIYLAPSVNEINNMVRNETSSIGGMNCSGTTDDFVKAGCWVTDLSQAYFIGGILALAGVIIAARVLASNE